MLLLLLFDPECCIQVKRYQNKFELSSSRSRCSLCFFFRFFLSFELGLGILSSLPLFKPFSFHKSGDAMSDRGSKDYYLHDAVLNYAVNNALGSQGRIWVLYFLVYATFFGQLEAITLSELVVALRVSSGCVLTWYGSLPSKSGSTGVLPWATTCTLYSLLKMSSVTLYGAPIMTSSTY